MSTDAIKKNLHTSDADRWFTTWNRILESYSNLKNPHETDEEIFLKQSQEELYDEFELIDEDADSTQYDTRTQLYINAFLNNSIKLIEARKNNTNENEVNEIVNEIEEIKKTQTKLSKRKVVKNLAWVIARLKQFSIDVFYDIMKDEAIAILMKSGIRNLID